jgi:chromosome segregation ATPase
MLLAALVLICAPPTVLGELTDSEKRAVTAIRTKLERLNREHAGLTANQMTLKNREQRLKDVDDMLSAAQRRHHGEVDDFELDAAAHEAAIDAHNAECPGGESPDEGFVTYCNSRADTLDAKSDQLAERLQWLQQLDDQLQEQALQLSEDTMKWAADEKRNRYELDQVNDRISEALAELRRALESGFLADLIKRERKSKHCEFLSELMPNHLEPAVHCLQQVWDGAR